MSSTLTLPDLRRAIGDLARRIGILERRVSTVTPHVADVTEIIFSFAGDLTATTSPPIRVPQAGILGELAVTLGTAGSSTTTILVERNGTTVGTVAVLSGVTAYDGPINARFAADSDVLTLTVSSAGTGAADMTAAARFT